MTPRVIDSIIDFLFNALDIIHVAFILFWDWLPLGDMLIVIGVVFLFGTLFDNKEKVG